MSIKYGDLTIIWQPLQRWVSWAKGEPQDQYIFLFDDTEICEVKDKYINFNFTFLNRIDNELPRYFKKPIEKEERLCIYFSQDNPNFVMFSAYSKNNICIKSRYNGIYYTYKNGKPDVFGIKRIKSTESMPRYQFAYDTNEFTKEEVMYLLYTIIKC